MKSLFYILIFFMLNIVSAQETITSAEYFIDTDPGVGNATAFNVSNGTSINSNFSVSTVGLSEGIHILHVRVKDNLDQWSLYARKTFAIKSITAPNTKSIVAAEFFFDSDPGVGNATSASITPGQTVNETLNVAVPTDLQSGDHYLQVRVLDGNGTWSLYARYEFEETLGITDFDVDKLLLYPNPISDILYVSLDGISIEKATLIDIHGRMVSVYSDIFDKIPMEHINSGIYLLKLETNKGIVSKKIIKK
ncbi:MAG: T9SS type A sorting domain-containing protein [Gelidibacter sp.]